MQYDKDNGVYSVLEIMLYEMYLEVVSFNSVLNKPPPLSNKPLSINPPSSPPPQKKMVGQKSDLCTFDLFKPVVFLGV